MSAQKRKHLLQKSSTKSGFTMVELSLTMAFVAVLLITIAVVTSNIMTIYQKGLTIKAVNSVGRGLTDEFITGVNSAPAVDTVSLCNNHAGNGKAACEDDNARKFVFQEYRENDKQYYGIFCTGNYSYLWNTYYGEEAGKTITFKYFSPAHSSGSGHPEKDINDDTKNPRLVRLKDSTYRLCSAALDSNYNSRLESGSITEIDITTLRSGSGGNYGKNTLSEEPEQGMLDAFDLDLE